MSVEIPRKSYRAFEPKWIRCRDTFDGQDAVKARGTIYLPKLETQGDGASALYEAYKARALYYNAMARTVTGLAGAVFRKDPTVTFPEVLKPQLDDVTLTTLSLDAFALSIFEEILKVGRVGVLVEMPREKDMVAGISPLGVDEKIRPYWISYNAEEIINWRTKRIGGRQVLVMVVLKETREEPKSDDPFTPVVLDRFRVLTLNPEGNYQVDIWQKAPDVGKFVLKETINPTRRGDPLKLIPFVFFGPTELSVDPQKPPLLDVADVNISHYQSSADLEHGRHFVGLPQPWISGGKSGAKLPIGSGVAWILPDHQSKAGMLEFTGQGLKSIEQALDDKRNMMATLGARILEQQKRVGEAAESIKLRTAGEQSVLRTIAFTTDRGLSTALKFHADWAGATEVNDETVNMQTNKDFVESRIPPEDLSTLLLMLQDGRISEETFYYNLERGEITVPGRTFEDEQKAIKEEEAQNIANRPKLPGSMREGGEPPDPNNLLRGRNRGDEDE